MNSESFALQCSIIRGGTSKVTTWREDIRLCLKVEYLIKNYKKKL